MFVDRDAFNDDFIQVIADALGITIVDLMMAKQSSDPEKALKKMRLLANSATSYQSLSYGRL